MGSKIVSEIELAVKANSKEALSSLGHIQGELTDLSTQIGKLSQFSQVLEGELQSLKKATDLDLGDYEKFGQVLEFAFAQVKELRTGIGKINNIENPFGISLDKPLKSLMGQLGGVEKELNNVFGEKQTLKVDVKVDGEALSESIDQAKVMAKVTDKAKQGLDELRQSLQAISEENKKINQTYLKSNADLTPKKLSNAYKRLNEQLKLHKKTKQEVSKFDFKPHDATATDELNSESRYAERRLEGQEKGIERLISKYNQLKDVKKKIDISGGVLDSLPEGHGDVPLSFDPGTGLKDQTKQLAKRQAKEQDKVSESVKNTEKSTQQVEKAAKKVTEQTKDHRQELAKVQDNIDLIITNYRELVRLSSNLEGFSLGSSPLTKEKITEFDDTLALAKEQQKLVDRSKPFVGKISDEGQRSQVLDQFKKTQKIVDVIEESAKRINKSFDLNLDTNIERAGKLKSELKDAAKSTKKTTETKRPSRPSAPTRPADPDDLGDEASLQIAQDVAKGSADIENANQKLTKLDKTANETKKTFSNISEELEEIPKKVQSIYEKIEKSNDIELLKNAEKELENIKLRVSQLYHQKDSGGLDDSFFVEFATMYDNAQKALKKSQKHTNALKVDLDKASESAGGFADTLGKDLYNSIVKLSGALKSDVAKFDVYDISDKDLDDLGKTIPGRKSELSSLIGQSSKKLKTGDFSKFPIEIAESLKALQTLEKAFEESGGDVKMLAVNQSKVTEEVKDTNKELEKTADNAKNVAKEQKKSTEEAKDTKDEVEKFEKFQKETAESAKKTNKELEKSAEESKKIAKAQKESTDASKEAKDEVEKVEKAQKKVTEEVKDTNKELELSQANMEKLSKEAVNLSHKMRKAFTRYEEKPVSPEKLEAYIGKSRKEFEDVKGKHKGYEDIREKQAEAGEPVFGRTQQDEDIRKAGNVTTKSIAQLEGLLKGLKRSQEEVTEETKETNKQLEKSADNAKTAAKAQKQVTEEAKDTNQELEKSAEESKKIAKAQKESTDASKEAKDEVEKVEKAQKKVTEEVKDTNKELELSKENMEKLSEEAIKLSHKMRKAFTRYEEKPVSPEKLEAYIGKSRKELEDVKGKHKGYEDIRTKQITETGESDFTGGPLDQNIRKASKISTQNLTKLDGLLRGLKRSQEEVTEETSKTNKELDKSADNAKTAAKAQKQVTEEAKDTNQELEKSAEEAKETTKEQKKTAEASDDTKDEVEKVEKAQKEVTKEVKESAKAAKGFAASLGPDLLQDIQNLHRRIADTVERFKGKDLDSEETDKLGKSIIGRESDIGEKIRQSGEKLGTDDITKFPKQIVKSLGNLESLKTIYKAAGGDLEELKNRLEEVEGETKKVAKEQEQVTQEISESNEEAKDLNKTLAKTDVASDKDGEGKGGKYAASDLEPISDKITKNKYLSHEFKQAYEKFIDALVKGNNETIRETISDLEEAYTNLKQRQQQSSVRNTIMRGGTTSERGKDEELDKAGDRLATLLRKHTSYEKGRSPLIYKEGDQPVQESKQGLIDAEIANKPKTGLKYDLSDRDLGQPIKEAADRGSIELKNQEGQYINLIQLNKEIIKITRLYNEVVGQADVPVDKVKDLKSEIILLANRSDEFYRDFSRIEDINFRKTIGADKAFDDVDKLVERFNTLADKIDKAGRESKKLRAGIPGAGAPAGGSPPTPPDGPPIDFDKSIQSAKKLRKILKDIDDISVDIRGNIENIGTVRLENFGHIKKYRESIKSIGEYAEQASDSVKQLGTGSLAKNLDALATAADKLPSKDDKKLEQLEKRLDNIADSSERGKTSMEGFKNAFKELNNLFKADRSKPSDKASAGSDPMHGLEEEMKGVVSANKLLKSSSDNLGNAQSSLASDIKEFAAALKEIDKDIKKAVGSKGTNSFGILRLVSTISELKTSLNNINNKQLQTFVTRLNTVGESGVIASDALRLFTHKVDGMENQVAALNEENTELRSLMQSIAKYTKKATDQFDAGEKALEKVGNQAKKTGKKLKNVEGDITDLDQVFDNMTQVIYRSDLFLGIGRSIHEYASTFIEAAAEMESFANTVKVTENNAEDAAKRMDRMIYLAKTLIGIDFKGLVQFNSQLRASNLTIEETDLVLISTARAIGELRKPVKVTTEVLRQLTQAIAAGRVERQDFKTILAEMPQFIQAARVEFGETVNTISQFRVAIEARGLTKRAGILLVLGRMNEMITGADPKSYAAQIEKLTESIFLLKVGLGEIVLPFAADIIGAFRDMVEWVDGFNVETKTLIAQTATGAAVTAAYAAVVSTFVYGLVEANVAIKHLTGKTGMSGLKAAFTALNIGKYIVTIGIWTGALVLASYAIFRVIKYNIDLRKSIDNYISSIKRSVKPTEQLAAARERLSKAGGDTDASRGSKPYLGYLEKAISLEKQFEDYNLRHIKRLEYLDKINKFRGLTSAEGAEYQTIKTLITKIAKEARKFKVEMDDALKIKHERYNELLELSKVSVITENDFRELTTLKTQLDQSKTSIEAYTESIFGLREEYKRINEVFDFTSNKFVQSALFKDDKLKSVALDNVKTSISYIENSISNLNDILERSKMDIPDSTKSRLKSDAKLLKDNIQHALSKIKIEIIGYEQFKDISDSIQNSENALHSFNIKFDKTDQILQDSYLAEITNILDEVSNKVLDTSESFRTFGTDLLNLDNTIRKIESSIDKAFTFDKLKGSYSDLISSVTEENKIKLKQLAEEYRVSGLLFNPGEDLNVEQRDKILKEYNQLEDQLEKEKLGIKLEFELVPDTSKHIKALKEVDEHIVSARKNIVTYLDKTTDKIGLDLTGYSGIDYLISKMEKVDKNFKIKPFKLDKSLDRDGRSKAKKEYEDYKSLVAKYRELLVSKKTVEEDIIRISYFQQGPLEKAQKYEYAALNRIDILNKLIDVRKRLLEQKTKDQLLTQSLAAIHKDDQAAFLESLTTLEISLSNSFIAAQQKFLDGIKRIKDSRQEIIEDISKQRFDNLKEGVEGGHILGRDYYVARRRFEAFSKAGSVVGYKDMLDQLDQAYNEYLTDKHDAEIDAAAEVAQAMYENFKDDLNKRTVSYGEFAARIKSLEKQSLLAQIEDYTKWHNEVIHLYKIANKNRKEAYIKAAEDAAEKSSDAIIKSFEDQVISFDQALIRMGTLEKQMHATGIKNWQEYVDKVNEQVNKIQDDRTTKKQDEQAENLKNLTKQYGSQLEDNVISIGEAFRHSIDLRDLFSSVGTDEIYDILDEFDNLVKGKIDERDENRIKDSMDKAKKLAKNEEDFEKYKDDIREKYGKKLKDEQKHALKLERDLGKLIINEAFNVLDGKKLSFKEAVIQFLKSSLKIIIQSEIETRIRLSQEKRIQAEINNTIDIRNNSIESFRDKAGAPAANTEGGSVTASVSEVTSQVTAVAGMFKNDGGLVDTVSNFVSGLNAVNTVVKGLESGSPGYASTDAPQAPAAPGIGLISTMANAIAKASIGATGDTVKSDKFDLIPTIHRILKSEGGYEPNKSDSYRSFAGITQTAYEEFLAGYGRSFSSKGKPAPLDVKDLGGSPGRKKKNRYLSALELEKQNPGEVRMDVIELFYKNYLDKFNLDELPEFMRYIVTDFATNAGSKSTQILNDMAGKLSVKDFFKGQMRLLDSNPFIDDSLILEFDKLKRKHYKKLYEFGKKHRFSEDPEIAGKAKVWFDSYEGWINRSDKVLEELDEFFEKGKKRFIEGFIMPVDPSSFGLDNENIQRSLGDDIGGDIPKPLPESIYQDILPASNDLAKQVQNPIMSLVSSFIAAIKSPSEVEVDVNLKTDKMQEVAKSPSLMESVVKLDMENLGKDLNLIDLLKQLNNVEDVLPNMLKSVLAQHKTNNTTLLSQIELLFGKAKAAYGALKPEWLTKKGITGSLTGAPTALLVSSLLFPSEMNNLTSGITSEIGKLFSSTKNLDIFDLIDNFDTKNKDGFLSKLFAGEIFHNPQQDRMAAMAGREAAQGVYKDNYNKNRNASDFSNFFGNNFVKQIKDNTGIDPDEGRGSGSSRMVNIMFNINGRTIQELKYEIDRMEDENRLG